jgi:hypothetical protein
MAPTGLVDMPPHVAMGLGGAADYMQLSPEFLARRALKIVDAFETQMHASGLASFESRMPEAEVLPAVVACAHCSDLVVIGQTDPSGTGSTAASAVPVLMSH